MRRGDLDMMDSGSNSTQTKAVMVCVMVAGLLTVASLVTTRSSPAEMSNASCNTHTLTAQPSNVDSVFNIKIVSDKDRQSKVKGKDNTWHSLVKSGTVTRTAATGKYSIVWNDEVTLNSKHSFNGRGMELSELIEYDGRTLSFDDTTGIVYEIVGSEAVPWQILSDGNGRHNKGYKSEWATIKGNLLYVGSMGKEWTDPKTAEVISSNPQWVKTLSPNGHVVSLDWANNYNALRKAAGTSAPGYMIHESANWHEGLQRWVFLPRRMSTEQYDDEKDEHRAANTMLLATENFDKIEVVKNIGPASETRGFSSFRFVPGHDSEFVALKSEEVGDVVRTFITVLDMKGKVLMEETLIDDVKFEGLEIFP